jgi:hypothetical protein
VDAVGQLGIDWRIIVSAVFVALGTALVLWTALAPEKFVAQWPRPRPRDRGLIVGWASCAALGLAFGRWAFATFAAQLVAAKVVTLVRRKRFDSKA